MTTEMPDAPGQPGTVLKPTLFIGSSTERLPIALSLKKLLTDCAEVTLWNEPHVFAPGNSFLNSLIKVGDLYDFAVLVFGQDDCTMMSGQRHPTVRDNVLFELGLFIGHMGRERAFWLSPRGSKAPTFPTDLQGIVHLEFDEPELTNTAAILPSLAETRDQIYRQIKLRGFRTSEVVPMRRALCLASSEYSQQRFQKDIEHIHEFFSGKVISEHGVTADRFYHFFSPEEKWDMVHLGLYVDKENQHLLFDTASGTGDKESLSIPAIKGMIKDSGAALVVIITCDSLRFGEQLARFTNVIAGHQAIAPSSALSWAEVFYQALSFGMPLFEAFDKAHDAADPGLVLLARRNIRFRRLTGK